MCHIVHSQKNNHFISSHKLNKCLKATHLLQWFPNSPLWYISKSNSAPHGCQVESTHNKFRIWDNPPSNRWSSPEIYHFQKILPALWICTFKVKPITSQPTQPYPSYPVTDPPPKGKFDSVLRMQTVTLEWSTADHLLGDGLFGMHHVWSWYLIYNIHLSTGFSNTNSNLLDSEL